MVSTAKKLILPFTADVARTLHAGDELLLSGEMFTGRDAAHRRLLELLECGAALPVDLRDAVIYYVGPTPAPPGRVIGSAGPTTAGRMDRYAPRLIAECGLRGMIGKGQRDAAVRQACQQYNALYFGAIGGLGALLGQCVRTAEVIAYPELGPEAIYRLTVENFPVVVVNDVYGGDLYQSGREKFTHKG